MAYAENTSVPIEKSRAEIERMLSKAGARRFASMTDDDTAMIGFELSGRMVRFTLPLPNRSSQEFLTRKNGASGVVRLNATDQAKKWDQACRSRWRALCLCIKAKLEAVEQGITTFDEEFLAHIVVPGGGTMGQLAIPQIDQAYQNGKVPRLLLEM